MKLTFVSPHKSITPFGEIDLPDLVVLTGVNGAGKSHLLEAIENGCIRIDDIVIDPQTRPIRLFNWTNLIPQDSGVFAPSTIDQEKYQLWIQLSQAITAYRPHLTQVLEQYKIYNLTSMSTRQLISMKPEDLISAGRTPEAADQIFQTVQNLTQAVVSQFTQNDPNRRRLIESIQNSSTLPLITFEEEEFRKYFPTSWQSVDMFQQSFARLFVEYHRNYLTNQLKILAKSRGKSVDFLTDIEFVKKFGDVPWDFVNSILKIANLGFSINQPPEYEDSSYEPILTDRIRGTKVKFADLSSGEKILMSFALCLYYAQDYRQIVDYPRVLLFDEIDAPLHPSMTQSLLRTIQEILVDRHKIKVILTTHSPSTVALSEESSIYAMYKDGNDRLKKVNKDKALAILTNGVPTLSISYENRHQVFVESEYDVEFYEQIYKKLKNELSSEISLNFIPSGGGEKGGCNRVKTVVKQLFKGGNRTVYGIIDWDLKNKQTDRVKVLGQGNRYSIDNYIFDPVILAAFLLLEGCITREMIGLEQNETDFDLRNFENDRLQVIANFIVDKLKPFKPENFQEVTRVCEYKNGKAVNIPSWLLEMQGHQLEINLKKTFSQLNKYQREADLKKEVINKIIDRIPSLIPMDFVSLFKEIQ